MIKLIAFDLDGTIGDTVPMCIRAFGKAVSPYAGHTLSEREITQTFGLNEVGMIKKVAGEKWREALHNFYPVYEKMHQSCPVPYEGIRELIETLQKAGVLVALITGKGDKSCRIMLKQFDMWNLFCSIKTGEEDRPNKAEAIGKLLHGLSIWTKMNFIISGMRLQCGRMQESGRNLPIRHPGNNRRRPQAGKSQPFKGFFQHKGINLIPVHGEIV